MSYPVRYYCPHCGAVVELERDGYLSDKSVTPYPLTGWEYADPGESFEDGDADGVRLVCGESDADGLRWTGEVSGADDVENPALESPCGSPFYLSFVRFEDGQEVDPVPESEYVDIGSGPRSGPRGPSGPKGPNGP
ncbi:hypothetical protein [Halogeometricum luteum]|uniref:DUF7969 domain-containing protein n=1 Tax=Halogeometricum luteum TaxID=2950537 RepID=A0ABU2G2Y1_9EURY|nr:hypothetical protein [Halogeometricum sp. S3BR5-2]MDS0294664.1 hypothetical protein [Halogeometricum sp. S3BR5-2]